MNGNNWISHTCVALTPANCLGRLALIMALMIVPSAVRGQALGQALNATYLTWTTSGWTAQTFTTHDGVSAADSGTLRSASATTTLQTTVNGPGTLTFWWSNPSLVNRLSFYVNGASLTYIISYGSTWLQQTYYLGEGSQTLKWVYSVAYPPADTYHSYVDQVSYTTGATAPLITAQPTGQSQVPGLNATFTVETGGTPPLYYQWKLNGTNLSGATTSAYTVTNVQADNLGNYSVEITNSISSIVSSNAALEFGQVAAWGPPAYSGTMVATGATNVLAVAAGNFSNLLLKEDNTLSGWGGSYNGFTNISANVTNAIAVASAYHCLVLNMDGTVTAWGGRNVGETNVPAGLSNVVAIAAARTPHSLALKSDGTVAAWGGYSYYGETNVPAGLTNVVAIAAGEGCDMALRADGTLTTWGTYAAVAPAGLSNVVGIAAGTAHQLALLANGTVVAWGNNSYGQTSVPTGLSNVVAIAASVTHSIALRADGTVVAWGQNNLGQTNVPTGLTNVVAISAASNHSLAQVGNGPPVLSASITNLTRSGNGFSLMLPSQSGRVYALEYKSKLSDANWVSLPLAAGTGTNLVLLDPTATSAQRFYHVRRW
jgi:alpha-tubulin suppressor-like RCC1 family protein